MSSDRAKVLQQAQLMASRGQYGEAIAEWKKLAAETPHDGSIHNSIGDLYLKRNANSEATASFLQAANAFQAEGATLKAIAAYKKVLKCDPARFEVYRHLGDLNADRGLIGSAVQDYLTLAKHYLKERKTKEALETYKKIVVHDPSNLSAQQRIAELCVQENLQDDATKVYLQLGRERSAQGRYEEAKEAYLSVLRIDPKNSEAAQFVESIKKGSAAPIQPAKPGGTSSSAASLSAELSGPLAEATRRIAEGQYAGAEAILNQMLSREPGNPRVCQLLAKLHLQQGDLQVALGEYRFLAGAALRAQDFILAESLIQEFLLAQPNSAPLLEMYGQLFEDRNDPAAAAQHYAKAVESLLTHPEPGMEGLHEELFEKVRTLSPDAGLVARLAAKIKGEPAAESGQSSQPEEPIVSELPTLNPQVVPSAADTFSIVGAEPDEFKMPAVPPGSSQSRETEWTGAEPDPVRGFEKQASAHPVHAAASEAEPDGGAFHVVVTPRHEAAQPVHNAGAGVSVTGLGASQASTSPPPDYEAHFTLGVAYKNMGLFQEAREEFDCSKEGEAYYLDSSLMIGLCHKEEGHLAQAIKGLEIVLADPRCHGTKSQAIRYELGLLYEAQAQWGKAVVTFQSIPSFHDVPQRLAALKTHRSSEGTGLRLAS